jgi:hypothetical protein
MQQRLNARFGPGCPHGALPEKPRNPVVRYSKHWRARPSTWWPTPLLCALVAVPCKVRKLKSPTCNLLKQFEVVRGVIQDVTGPGRT